MSETTRVVAWYVEVRLRGSDDPIWIVQSSQECAYQTIAYVASTWLRLPPEARPASCWCPSPVREHVTIGAEGVAAEQVDLPVAAIDPREIAAVTVVRSVERVRAQA